MFDYNCIFLLSHSSRASNSAHFASKLYKIVQINEKQETLLETSGGILPPLHESDGVTQALVRCKEIK